MSAYIDVQVTHDLLEYLALGDRTVIQGDHFGNALKREADLSGLRYRRSEPSTTRASELVSQRCVFVQDASQHLPRVKTTDLASGTLFGSSVGMDDRYDFER